MTNFSSTLRRALRKAGIKARVGKDGTSAAWVFSPYHRHEHLLITNDTNMVGDSQNRDRPYSMLRYTPFGGLEDAFAEAKIGSISAPRLEAFKRIFTEAEPGVWNWDEEKYFLPTLDAVVACIQEAAYKDFR